MSLKVIPDGQTNTPGTAGSTVPSSGAATPGTGGPAIDPVDPAAASAPGSVVDPVDPAAASAPGAFTPINPAPADKEGAVRFDVPQTLSDSQQTQARTNMDVFSSSEVSSMIAEYGQKPFFCAPGDKIKQAATTLTIRDGGAKAYNAFPHMICVGSKLYVTVCSMTGHVSRDSDVWLYTSEDYGAGEWTGSKIYSASGTAGAIVNGDKEYRYAGLAHLGGSKIMVLMHTYVEGTGGNAEWAVSTDMGQTWGALQAVPMQGSNTSQACAGNPCLFKGRVYLGFYGGGTEYMLSQSLAEIEVGTNDNWRREWTGNGTENYLKLSSDGLTLLSYSRVADIWRRSTVDGSTWNEGSGTGDGYAGLDDWEPTQPCVEELQDGTLVHVGRRSSLGLEARLFYKAVDGDDWAISDDVLTDNREIPAWDGVEKHMYSTIIPFGGSLFGVVYALEAHEEWNSTGHSTGDRASVYFSFFAAGKGMTPLGRFVPRDSEVLAGDQIELGSSPLRLEKTLAADTKLTIVGDGEGTELIVDGDYALSFERSMNVVGNYDGSSGKSALLEIRDKCVNIITRQGFDPRDLPGCNLLLTPESLVDNGAIVTAWTDLSDAGHSVTTTAGKEPALASSASPNGKDCVQGALDDYFVFAAAGGIFDVGSIYALFNYPNANFDGYNTIVPNIIQGDGTTDDLKWNPGANAPYSGKATINGTTYSAATYDPTAWAAFGVRNLLPGAATIDRPPWDMSGWSRLMTQVGFESTRSWLGKLVCFVAFDRRLTDAEDVKMQQWLSLQ